MTVDLAVVGGTLATADGTVRAGLAVDSGRIATIGREADRPPSVPSTTCSTAMSAPPSRDCRTSMI